MSLMTNKITFKITHNKINKARKITLRMRSVSSVKIERTAPKRSKNHRWISLSSHYTGSAEVRHQCGAVDQADAQLHHYMTLLREKLWTGRVKRGLTCCNECSWMLSIHTTRKWWPKAVIYCTYSSPWIPQGMFSTHQELAEMQDEKAKDHAQPCFNAYHKQLYK